MCGLVGIAGDIRDPHKKMFKQMLVFDQVRGYDSTGIAVVYSSLQPHISDKLVVVEKDLGAAQNLWEYSTSKMFDAKGLIAGGVKALIGHNRAATRGKVTIENAHPFHKGHVVGAHNGSLTYWKELKDAHRFDVDSEAIFHDISHNGIEKTWENFYGAAALVWWDEEEDTINFARNSQRPLVYVWSKDRKTLFWASELWMITVAASRCHIPLEANEGSKAILYREFEEGQHYSYKVSPLSVTFTKKTELKKKYVYNNTRNTGSTYMGSAGFNTGQPGFTLYTNWKEGTKRSCITTEGIQLQSPRYYSRFLAVGKYQDIFQMDMVKGGNIVGIVEIYPTNKAEYDRMVQLIADRKMLARYDIKFNDNPRVRKEQKHPSFLKYVCAASSISITEVKVPSANKTEEKKDCTNVTQLFTYKSPHGNYVSEKLFMDYLKGANGVCCYCQQTLELEDSEGLQWLDTTSVLCAECSSKWGEGWGGYYCDV